MAGRICQGPKGNNNRTVPLVNLSQSTWLPSLEHQARSGQIQKERRCQENPKPEGETSNQSPVADGPSEVQCLLPLGATFASYGLPWLRQGKSRQVHVCLPIQEGHITKLQSNEEVWQIILVAQCNLSPLSQQAKGERPSGR